MFPRSIYPPFLSGLRPALSVLVAFWALIAGCHRGGISPDGDPDALTIQAQQTELLNNPYLPVALSGDYRAVKINWNRFENSQYYTEGYSTYDAPDTAFIKSDYRLKVTPTAGNDSIRLTFSGNGYGGSFTNHDLGTFAMTRFDGKKYYDPLLDYLSESWQFGRHNLTEEYQIRAGLTAYANKTELGFGFLLGRIITPSSPRYGQVAVVVPGEYNPSDIPRNFQPWGNFSFTRRSTGILLNRR